MIMINNDIPIKESCFDSIQSKIGQVRDLLIEIEQEMKFAEVTKDYFLTRKETAEFFRCDPKKIPRQIPRMRRGNDLLFLRSDIDAYVKQKLKK